MRRKSRNTTIEMYTPYGEVLESFVVSIRKKILALTKAGTRISRAEVVLKQDPDLRTKPMICAIRLSIYGDSLFVRRHADTYKKAVEATIAQLRRLVRKVVVTDKEPAEVATSTVRI